MKTGTLLVTITVIAVGFVSCTSKEAQWQGTIEEVDGVTIVKNSIIPFYGEFVPELEEDLRIGDEDDDNYRFYQARAITLDSEDNIYVVDRGNYRIQKFDGQGRYLRTIGRKGQGPGEFQGLLGIYVDVHDNLYAYEYKRIHVFTKYGEYQSSLSLDYHLVEFSVDSDGYILGYCDLHSRDIARRGIVKLDDKGKIDQIIAEYTDLGIKVVIGQNATYTLSPNHVYTPRLVFASIAQDVFTYGYSSEYLINIVDKKGNSLLSIRKSDDPILITKSEKEFIVSSVVQTLEQRQIPISKQMVDETIHFDKNRSFYNRILTDDKSMSMSSMYLLLMDTVFT